MAERSLRFDLIANDKSFSRTLDQMGRKGQSLNRKLERSFGDSGGRAGQQYGARFNQRLGGGLSASTRIARLSGAAIGAGLAVAGLGKFATDSVKLAATFDRTMRQVASVTKVPVARIGELRKVALDMGATTSFSARQAGEAMLELGKGGLTFAEQRAGGLSATLTLAAAGSLELGQAAGFVVQGLKTFGLRAGQAGQVAAALAGAANASTASVEDMGLSLSQSGAMARNAGLSIKETTGVLAAFANNGIAGSDAGTSLKTMLQRLIPTTNAAKDSMRDLGLKFTDAHGAILPITEIAQRLQDRLKGLSEAQRISALSTIFGSDAIRAATILMREGATGLAKYIKATSDQAAAEKLAKTNTEGAAGAFERLSGAVETIQIQIGDAFLPVLADAADWLARVLPGALQRVSDWLSRARAWWQDNAYEIGLVVNVLRASFVPATRESGSAVDSFSASIDRIQKGLNDTLVVVARLSQGWNWLVIATQETAASFADLIIGAGYAANAVDRLSGGSGHAADEIVRFGRQVKANAIDIMGQARTNIDQAGVAIGNLNANTRRASIAANDHAGALANEKNAIDALNGALRSEEGAELDVRQAKLNVASAQSRLTELTKGGKRGSLEYRQAQIDLKRAQIDLADKTAVYRLRQREAAAATGGAMRASQQATPPVRALGEAARVGGGKAGAARIPWRKFGEDVSAAYREIHSKSVKITAGFGWQGLKVFRTPGGALAEAKGGKITVGTGPTADDVPAWLSKGEAVVPARAASDPWFESWAASQRIPGFAVGGRIPSFGMRGARGFVNALGDWPEQVERVMALARARFKKLAAKFGGKPGVLNFIRSLDPLPYIWGGGGPGGYDCSGAVGAVHLAHLGRPHGHGQRLYTTGSIHAGIGGLRPGLGGVLEIGVTPARGHMAGRYGGPRGLGFEAESTRTGIKIGAAASRPESFARHFHLARGGRITEEMLERFAALGLDIGGDADKLRIDGKVLDRGGWLMPGTTIAQNRTGRPERVVPPGPMTVTLDPASARLVADHVVRGLHSTPIVVSIDGNQLRTGIKTAQRRAGYPPAQQIR